MVRGASLAATSPRFVDDLDRLRGLEAGEPHRIGRATGFKIQVQLALKYQPKRMAPALLNTLREVRDREDTPYLRRSARSRDAISVR